MRKKKPVDYGVTKKKYHDLHCNFKSELKSEKE